MMSERSVKAWFWVLSSISYALMFAWVVNVNQAFDAGNYERVQLLGFTLVPLAALCVMVQLRKPK